MVETLLENVAKDITELFPDLEGRSIAVSEADITKENMPTLPLCMVALLRIDADSWVWQAANGAKNLSDDFMVEFWLKPIKYVREDKTESPFWAYYDYEAFRDRMLSWATGYYGPRGQRLGFSDMTVESDQYAVVLSFRFKAHYNWCRTDEDEGQDGKPVRIVSNLCTPKPCIVSCSDLDKKDCGTCNESQ